MDFFPNCCLFFVYNSVSIGQNLLNEKPVENSLLVDFAYCHFNSFNGNLNGYQSPGWIICIGPCGPKTTKADDKLEALVQWRIQGRGPGPLLFLDLNEARKAEKKFFLRLPPPAYLRVLITAPPPPTPYLKVWIRHCSAPIHCAESRIG